MNLISEFASREIQGFGNPWAYLFYFGILALIFLTFGLIYRTKGVEFFDGRYSEFESSFMKKLAQYWLWALIQQSIVFTGIYFIPLRDELLYPISLFIFSVLFHLPNLKLMGFTFGFAAICYFGYFFAGFTSLVMLSFAHAFGGTLYYKLGWDMRSWRFK